MTEWQWHSVRHVVVLQILQAACGCDPGCVLEILEGMGLEGSPDECDGVANGAVGSEASPVGDVGSLGVPLWPKSRCKVELIALWIPPGAAFGVGPV